MSIEFDEDLGDAALLEQTRAHSVFWGTAYEFGDEIPRMPARMERLPRDHAGRPVPWFVAWIDGKPDFRVIAPDRITDAITNSLCWVCGQHLGKYAAFLIGPMCAINRTTAEPPSHRDCATWSAQLCPFLANPERRRRDSRLPNGVVAPSGEAIRRNPGVAHRAGDARVDRGVQLMRIDNTGRPRTCLNCGEPLPYRPWWKRLILGQPPIHNPRGPEGDACWLGLSRRMGVKNPGPKPSAF